MICDSLSERAKYANPWNFQRNHTCVGRRDGWVHYLCVVFGLKRLEEITTVMMSEKGRYVTDGSTDRLGKIKSVVTLRSCVSHKFTFRLLAKPKEFLEGRSHEKFRPRVFFLHWLDWSASGFSFFSPNVSRAQDRTRFYCVPFAKIKYVSRYFELDKIQVYANSWMFLTIFSDLNLIWT